MTARHNFLAPVRSIVIKLGTQLLSDKAGRLNTDYVADVARQIAALRQRGLLVTLVSSGAIGSGLAELGIARRPTDLPHLQAIAAIGQRRLMDAWADAFSPHKLHVAQILLTREDVEHRTRFLNLRNTIHAIHELGGVPIINENDTISTDELIRISFGDNDILAAVVAHALRADLLVLLSVVDGLLDANGKPLRTIEKIEDALPHLRAEKSALGKGGMNSKLTAARMVTDAGEIMMVADGRSPDILINLLDGHELGTLFKPAARKMSSRSRWIGAVRPTGHIVVDDGAAAAITSRRRSLLPAGITRIEGAFKRGAVVGIVNASGDLIARGLSNYTSEDVQRIAGKKTAEVRTLLGGAAYDEVIHRDNLVISMQ